MDNYRDNAYTCKVFVPESLQLEYTAGKQTLKKYTTKPCWSILD